VKYIISLAFVLKVISISSQTVHHQMVSSQSTSGASTSGLIIKQTIGQTSATGSFFGKFSVQQGYQQSNWTTHLLVPEKISITRYPNPFTQFINFNFIDSRDDPVRVQIFDINGKSVYLIAHTVKNKSIRINLSMLTTGSYLVKITNQNLYHFTKIIKN
jgi:hypothetical protein